MDELNEAGSRHNAQDAQHIADADAHIKQAIGHMGHAQGHVKSLGELPTQGMGAYGAVGLLASDRAGDGEIEESLTESAGERVPIVESVAITSISEATSVEKDGILTMRLIQPGFNASRQRYYTKEALAEAHAKGTFVKKMYLDHPTKAEESDLPERSVAKIGAVIKETFLDADGSLWGKAALVNIPFKETLAAMERHGVLGTAIGVSINATGRVRTGTVEGRKTNVVEAFHEGRSVDFVTEPGAGGRIALFESDRRQEAAIAAQEQGVFGMNEEQMRALVENAVKSAIAPLEAENAALSQRLRESDAAREAAEKRATVAATVQRQLAAIAEADLPAFAKERIQLVMEGAESVERLEEAITREKAYVKAIAEHYAATKRTGAVTGMGGNVNKVGTSGDTLAPMTTTEAVDALSEAGGSLFGGKETFANFLQESLRA